MSLIRVAEFAHASGFAGPPHRRVNRLKGVRHGCCVAHKSEARHRWLMTVKRMPHEARGSCRQTGSGSAFQLRPPLHDRRRIVEAEE
jgi:hypothetical protein